MKKILSILAASLFVFGVQTASASTVLSGPSTWLKVQPKSAVVNVHSKRCKFYHPDGYTYKDHCPHGVQKGDRKKRAGIGAGVGAATGAIIGGIVGGGKAAGIGAAVGAGAGALGGAASVRKCWYTDQYGRQVHVKCRQ